MRKFKNIKLKKKNTSKTIVFRNGSKLTFGKDSLRIYGGSIVSVTKNANSHPNIAIVSPGQVPSGGDILPFIIIV